MNNRSVVIPFVTGTNTYLLFKGTVVKVTDDEFEVRFDDDDEVVPYELETLAKVLVPKVGEYVLYDEPGQTTRKYVGLVKKVDVNPDGWNKYCYECTWGDREKLGWNEAAFDPISRWEYFPQKNPKTRLTVILEGNKFDDGGTWTTERMELHNLGGGKITSAFPVDLYAYLRLFAEKRSVYPLVVNSDGVKARLDDLLSEEGFLGVDAIPESAPVQAENDDDAAPEESYHANLVIRGTRRSVGWSTIDNKLDKVGLKYSAIRAKATIDGVELGYQEFVKAHKTHEAPDDLMGKLIKSKLLQGVELTTMTSFFGSRVHQKLLLDTATTTVNLDGPAVDPQPVNPVFVNKREKKEEVNALVFNKKDLFDLQVKSIETMAPFNKLINQMCAKVKSALTDAEYTIIACELPVFSSMKTYTHNDDEVAMESRVDFLASKGGRIILGDYKTRWGNGNQFKILASKELRQVLVYAFLVLENYHIFIDAVMVVYVNRSGDTTLCEIPFTEELTRGRSNRGLGRASVCKQEIDAILQKWLNVPGTVCGKYLISKNPDLPKALRYDEKYSRLWYNGDKKASVPERTLAQLRDAIAEDAENFFKGDGLERRSGRNIMLRYGAFNLYSVKNDVYSWESLNTVPANELAGARFFHPELIHPDIDSRYYTPFISKVNGRLVEESDRKAELRRRFNNLVYERSEELMKGSGRRSGNQLQTMFGLTKKQRPSSIGMRTWKKTVCVRALQIELNRRLLQRLKVDGVVRQQTFRKAATDNVESYPLASARFKLFKELSQRPAWSNQMYEWTTKQIDAALKLLLLKITN